MISIMDTFNGKIYKIINSKNDKVYIGSTCIHKLKYRLSTHKSKMKHRLDEPFYAEMNELGKENFSIILLESGQFQNKIDLLKLEDKYIDGFKILTPELSLNNNMAAPSIEEKKATKKKYYLKHKERIYKVQRDRITKDKESHEKTKQYMRNYRRRRTLCKCGVSVIDNKSSIRDHEKTKRHIRLIN